MNPQERKYPWKWGPQPHRGDQLHLAWLNWGQNTHWLVITRMSITWHFDHCDCVTGGWCVDLSGWWQGGGWLVTRSCLARPATTCVAQLPTSPSRQLPTAAQPRPDTATAQLCQVKIFTLGLKIFRSTTNYCPLQTIGIWATICKPTVDCRLSRGKCRDNLAAI